MEALWPELPSGPAIQVWHQSDRRTHYFTTGRGAAEHAAKAQNDNIYVAAGLALKALAPSRKRSNAEEVIGIPGLWADIDVNGGPEQKTGAAPDRDTALALANELIEPTVVVNSGYGFQAWWLFDGEPWIFSSPAEREQAKRLVAAFQAALKGKAALEGFTIDSTFDLARLMRIPETLNHKGVDQGFKPASVELLEGDGPRYQLQTFAAIVDAYMGEAIEATRRTTGEGIEANARAGAQPPLEKLDLLTSMDPDFKTVWEHKRTAKTRNWSMSQFEMSIANCLVRAGWDDQEVADAIVYHRNRFEPGDPRKKNRTARIRQTIGKARQAVQTEYFKEEALFEREQAIDQMQGGSGPLPKAADAPRKIALFSKICGGPQVKELLQDGRDPETARFRLALADGREVPLGKMTNLQMMSQFQQAFAIVTSHYPLAVSKPQWERIVGELIAHATVNEGAEDTRSARVRGWLEGYLDRKLSTDKDAACEAYDPFVKDGVVYVPASNLRLWLRKMRDERIEDADLKQYLKAAGFERKTVGYRKSNGDKSTRSYYFMDEEALESEDKES